jgi:hypothetical protein
MQAAGILVAAADGGAALAARGALVEAAAGHL